MKKLLSIIISITILLSMATVAFADEPTGVLVGEQNKEDNDKLIYGYQVDDTGKILNLSELKKFYIEFAMDNRIDFIPDFDEKDYKTNNPVSTEDFLMLTYYMNKDNLSEDLSMSAELVEKVMRENFGIEKVEHKSQFKGWTYVEEENKYTPYPEGTAEDGIFDVINFNSYKENGKKIYDVTLREYYLPFLFSIDDSALSDIYNSYVEYTKNEENAYRENVLFLLAEKGEKIKNAEINIYNALYDLIVEDNTDGFTAGKTIRIKYYIDKTTGNPRFIYKNEEKNTLETSGTPLAPPSEWAAKDIDHALAVGITDYGKDYLYKENITREEFCELIYNLIVLTSDEITAPITDSFKDTKNEKILMLNGLGIINGKSATEFAPNDYLTREEAATIIDRMVEKGYAKINTGTTAQWITFSDEKEISDWALFSVQNIYKMGIMNGVGDNKFAPQETYTTEQAIASIVRVYAAQSANKGIIGGADTPTEIYIGEDVEVSDFYIEEALKHAQKAGELAGTKEFIAMYIADEDVKVSIDKLSKVSFSEPSDMYYIAFNRDKVVEFYENLISAEDAVESFDIEKFIDLNGFNLSVFSSKINARYGATTLAATAVLTSREGYIMPKDFENDFGVYLKYDGDYSALVTFSKIGDEVIEARMQFVRNGEKTDMLMYMAEIYDALGNECITIGKIK